jgi:hypothetical protein
MTSIASSTSAAAITSVASIPGEVQMIPMNGFAFLPPSASRGQMGAGQQENDKCEEKPSPHRQHEKTSVSVDRVQESPSSRTSFHQVLVA